MIAEAHFVGPKSNGHTRTVIPSWQSRPPWSFVPVSTV
jgi:hypothetical protein